jgi:sigma-B regulation protein RsbU (phosphoserine phosphatase)
MRKGYREVWGRIGRVEKILLGVLVVYAFLRLTGLSPGFSLLAGLAAFVLATVVAVRWTARLTRKAIWRLRNRLIVAYLFIAVVPIVLIVTLAGLSGYLLVGEVAAYFVRTGLEYRENSLLSQAERLSRVGGRVPGPGGQVSQTGRGGAPADAQTRVGPPPGGRFSGFQGFGGGASGRGLTGGRFPAFIPRPASGFGDPEGILSFIAEQIPQTFPGAEVLVTTDEKELHYPSESKLNAPPPEWGRASGLVLRDDGSGRQKVYMWAHVVVSGANARPPARDAQTPEQRTGQSRSRAPAQQPAPQRPIDVRQVTIVVPVTSQLLSQLHPRLNFVWIPDYVDFPAKSRTPNPVNAFDIEVTGLYPMQIAHWKSPAQEDDAYIFVRSRLSTILGIIFETRPGQPSVGGDIQVSLLVVAALFLFVETASLYAGIKLTRSMTGAVNEIYEGTRHVKEGDFSYRIPVKGGDQLAEMGASFNTMTENLGQLIVVAKEKERLQSELEIAREVQNQLFPKDSPSIKSLELRGVCKPARMVSGDYYDFLTLPGSELAFAIGDVAGKGISAALLMATIQSTMRTQLNATNGSGPKHLSAQGLVGQLNRQLYANTSPEKYATFFFAIYDEATCALTYTNAGHLPPLLVRSGEFINLDPTGTVVGAFPFAKYEERTLALEEGDILVAYTDGVVEPENPYGEMFGENRLKDMVLRYARAGASEIIAHTMEAVIQWTGSEELQDDMTMIVARRI